MKKAFILTILLLFFFVFANLNTIFASEDSDKRDQATDEYYAKRYNYPTYFYEETVYYKELFNMRESSFKKILLYQHQSPSGLPTIRKWEQKQITPWVDFVPGATISAGSGTSSTFTTSWSITGGIEVPIFKELVKASLSASYEESYSKSYHQEHGIVASYEYAINVLGTSSGFTDYSIAFRQGMGEYKTFNYEGLTLYWYSNTFMSAQNIVKTWKYVGLGYFYAPLPGIEYTKYTVTGTIQ